MVINDSNGKYKALYGSHTRESRTVFTQGPFRDNGDTLNLCHTHTKEIGIIRLKKWGKNV